eukprot:2487532-Amphidinium_carterae.1
MTKMTRASVEWFIPPPFLTKQAPVGKGNNPMGQQVEDIHDGEAEIAKPLLLSGDACRFQRKTFEVTCPIFGCAHHVAQVVTLPLKASSVPRGPTAGITLRESVKPETGVTPADHG